jgi:phage terminase large subunit-like protein
VFCGLDFSHGDDLFAISYLGVDYKRSESPRGHLFADCDAWVLEETMKQSPNRPLYEQWVKDGWLHVCPGEVFDSMLAMNRLAEIVQQGIDIVTFGYDPAQNRSPINQLKAWLQTLFQSRQDVSPKELAQVIERMVVPVSQTAMTLNPTIGHLEDLVKDKEEILYFSNSPLWPWQFGNCAVEISTSNLRRIIKGGPPASHKIDNIMALLDATWCFDLSEGQVTQ